MTLMVMMMLMLTMMILKKSIVSRFRSDVDASVERNTLSSQYAADVVRTDTVLREIED